MQRMKQPDNVNSAPVKERFKCPYEDCDATFRSENTLNLHVNNAHGFEDMEEFRLVIIPNNLFEIHIFNN